MQTTNVIDPSCSVRETIAQYPATKDVFTRFGLDTCCGAGAAITDAAQRDGADLGAVLDALRKVTAVA